MEPSFFYILSAGLFLLGLIVGSFLNVLVLRFHSGRTLMGRSGCLSCNTPLSALELVPVLSFLLLGGRCRVCRSSISLQYPLVEFGTGLLFLGSILLFDFSTLSWQFIGSILSYFVMVSALVALVAYDFKHQIIPDSFVFVFALAALLLHLFNEEPLTPYLLAGPILAAPFVGLWYLSRGKYMGLGDGKFVVGMGFLLGLSKGLSAIIFGFWAGAIFGIVLLIVSRLRGRLSLGGVPLTMKSEVPFAPFLALGTVLVLFARLSLFDSGLFVSLF